MAKSKKPLTATDATDAIREIGNHFFASFWRTNHFEERLEERNLSIEDVLAVLENGFVTEPPKESTQKGLYKCKIVGKSPSSGNRQLAIIVIPDEAHMMLKLITIYWVDENN